MEENGGPQAEYSYMDTISHGPECLGRLRWSREAFLEHMRLLGRPLSKDRNSSLEGKPYLLELNKVEI